MTHGPPRKNADELIMGYGRILKHADCYMKEARSILQGKNTAGKNKCVELPEESQLSSEEKRILACGLQLNKDKHFYEKEVVNALNILAFGKKKKIHFPTPDDILVQNSDGKFVWRPR